jgi:hypothetical protein
LLGGGVYFLGEANQKSKEDVRHQIYEYSGAMRWGYYELTLFGDPALPFGARISPVHPTIACTPLGNQMGSAGSYRVACTFGPAGIFDPDSPQLLWRSSRAPDVVHTSQFAQVSGMLHEAFIPPVPEGATIYYRILLSSRAGIPAVAPVSGEYSFQVTCVVDLTVSGDPQPCGNVSPGYGTMQVASGNTIKASADARVVLPGGTQARRCTGWTGTGSVPAAGSSNRVNFVAEENSTLTWHWQEENRLYLHASPVSVFAATSSWFSAGSTAQTVVAAAGVSTYRFIGWYVDGARVPATGRAVTQAGGIAMDQPHDAEARYLPVTQDTDADGVPDWWEMKEYGTLGWGAVDDTDGDGASLLQEYLALTNPNDPASYPVPPAIAVTPLGAMISTPPPLTLYVNIVDTSPLTAAWLVWRQNGGEWTSNALALVSADTSLYAGVINTAAACGDQFEYLVQAAALDGLSAVSGVHTTRLEYAYIRALPPLARAYVTIPPGSVCDTFSLSNTGTASLAWQACAGLGEYADVPPPSNWNLSACGQSWSWTTARYLSASGSLHTAIASPFPPAGVGQHACMDMPEVTLGTNALLAFSYWINSELDNTQYGHCWDGGIVEISTNGGLSFEQVPGPYNYVISGWQASPWVNGTACLAGNGSGWQDVAFDLSRYAGRPAIIRFNYGADDNNDREGWYVDNIRLAPLQPAARPGIVLLPAAGSVAPGAAGSFVAAVDTSSFLQRWLRVPILVRCNDPFTPYVWFELAFESRHAPIVTLAAVCATNGSGLVSINGEVVDPDGEDRRLSFRYSCDHGATWSTPRLQNAAFACGTGTLNAASGWIDHAVSPAATPVATNRFALQWNTRHPSNNVAVSLQTLLRISVGDPVYTNTLALAPAFPVDNAPPDVPTLHLVSAAPQSWTASRTFTFNWTSSDGDGVGLRDAEVMLARPNETTNILTWHFDSPPALASLDSDADSSNWWLTVVARDAMGNAATNRSGPFWVDTAPPSAGTAAIAVAPGRGGGYFVANCLPVAGSNFADALSGIASYTFANLARPDVAPVVTNTARIDWSALADDVTNTFRVVATDRAGNVSTPVFVRALVLDPLGDADQDGVPNGIEELIGSSPLAPSAPFALSQTSAVDGPVLTLRWPSASGSRYTVECAGELANGGWNAVPGLENMPGTNGEMSAVVPLDAGSGFYRVRVAP